MNVHNSPAQRDGVASAAKTNMIIAGAWHNNIRAEDSLRLDCSLWPVDEDDARYDFIVTDPPFGTSETDSLPRSAASGYSVSGGKGQHLFLQRMVMATKTGGLICTVIDEGLLNTDGAADLREWSCSRPSRLQHGPSGVPFHDRGSFEELLLVPASMVTAEQQMGAGGKDNTHLGVGPATVAAIQDGQSGSPRQNRGHREHLPTDGVIDITLRSPASISATAIALSLASALHSPGLEWVRPTPMTREQLSRIHVSRGIWWEIREPRLWGGEVRHARRSCGACFSSGW
jgi:N-6 DNA Methylase